MHRSELQIDTETKTSCFPNKHNKKGEKEVYLEVGISAIAEGIADQEREQVGRSGSVTANDRSTGQKDFSIGP